MVSGSRLHELCCGYAVLLGLANLIGALAGGATVTRVTLGLLYVLVAVYQLWKRGTPRASSLAVQRAD
jgi:hypothetical protein